MKAKIKIISRKDEMVNGLNWFQKLVCKLFAIPQPPNEFHCIMEINTSEPLKSAYPGFELIGKDRWRIMKRNPSFNMFTIQSIGAISTMDETELEYIGPII